MIKKRGVYYNLVMYTRAVNNCTKYGKINTDITYVIVNNLTRAKVI